MACIKPAFDFFVTKFEHELKPSVDAFKAAQLFLLPNKVNDLCPDSSSVDSLKAFPFYQNSTHLDHLKAELPCYLSSSVDLGEDVDPLDWWKRHSEKLPHWLAAASTVLVVHPPRQQRSTFFHCYSAVLEINKKPHSKTILKPHLCYSLMDIKSAFLAVLCICIIILCNFNFNVEINFQ